jgi:hemerythrin-like domain-containing protein
MFSKAREEQLALCTTLEAIADSLPDRVDRGVCVSTAKALAPLIDHAHRMEEDILFPTLRAAGLVTADLAAALERFKIEHAGDEFFAEELVDVLLSYGAGTPTQSAEATGYMLRGFFETLRRHIASEQELLLPVMEGLNGSTNGLSH